MAIISSPGPTYILQINRIRHTEILKRTQQLPINCFRQTNLRRNPMVKICQYVLSVHSFRCCGQTKKNFRRKRVQRLLINCCSSMMKLIHNNKIIIISR